MHDKHRVISVLDDRLSHSPEQHFAKRPAPKTTHDSRSACSSVRGLLNLEMSGSGVSRYVGVMSARSDGNNSVRTCAANSIPDLRSGTDLYTSPVRLVRTEPHGYSVARAAEMKPGHECCCDRVVHRMLGPSTVSIQNTHIDRFIEQLGRLAEGEGLPRTAGRMMGVLMICGAPMDINELATRLQVSRASISTNSRLLQSLAIANLVMRPGDRRDYLQISGDPCSSLLMLGLRRMESMRGAIRQMRLAMNGAQFGAPRARLKRMERFYDLAITQGQTVLATWRDAQERPDKVIATNAAPLLLPKLDDRPGRGSRSSARRASARDPFRNGFR